MQNDKIQLAAMGEHIAEQPLCMAKRIEELESKCKAAMDMLREMLGFVDGTKWQALIDERKAHVWLGRIEALLDGQAQEAAPDAMVSLSDIASLQRYTLGGHCDSFGQDCGAEMEQDDEGEYVLLAEAMMLAASPKPDAK